MEAVYKRKAFVFGGVFSLLSAILAPIVASAATSTSSTTINATVAATISMTSGTTVNIGLTPTTGGVVSSASDTVSVSTNNTTGYTLSVANTDANTNLVSGANTIAAHAGTQASPTALAVNTWGYRVVGVGGFTGTAYSAETNNGSSTSTWAGIPAAGSGNVLKTTSAVASADTTTVWYAVRANSTKAAGTYTDSITYTAVTN